MPVSESGGSLLMTLIRTLSGTAAILVGLLQFGCQPRYTTASPQEGDTGVQTKIPAEAYTFNSRLKRDGKPTTVKLELYHADTVIGLAGRAYLGKGALKGRLTGDSMVVYFPASNEYVREAISDLAARGECPIPLTQLHLLELFRQTPDSIDLPPEVSVVGNYQDQDRPFFLIFAEGCAWQVELEYQRRDEGWRPRRFEFDDGDRISFKAELERFRGDAWVATGRFEPVIPGDAVRISP